MNTHPARCLGLGPFTQADRHALEYDDDGHPGISFTEALQSQYPFPCPETRPA
ncbi:hypothetical protein [Streptomyces sp. NBC_01244]|uniref:hypothetical protein n=1 Tax=Streptomyces sp. NBC_01244 TaxID=2903797 RepID=UPI002E139525|nr:hypothetical protein OG247_44365 [Streptomyces sp. NBC_01244]